MKLSRAVIPRSNNRKSKPGDLDVQNFYGIESIYFYVLCLLQVYQGELNLEDGETFHDRPPLEIVIRCRHFVRDVDIVNFLATIPVV
jgi:hypothetical protein